MAEEAMAQEASEQPDASEAQVPEASETPTEGTQDQTGEGAAESAETEGEGSGPPKPKKPNPAVQKRIDELTRARREAEERAAKAEQALCDREREADPEPDPTTYKDEYGNFDQAAYIKAEREWRKREEQRNQPAQTSPQEPRDGPSPDLQTAAERLRAENPEAFQTLSSLPTLSSELALVVTDAEDPAQLANWLGQNPGEAARLSGLSATQVAREVGKIEARLTQSAPQKKAVSDAPPPPKTVRQSGTGQPKTLGQMTMAEYRKYRTEQERAKQS